MLSINSLNDQCTISSQLSSVGPLVGISEGTALSGAISVDQHAEEMVHAEGHATVEIAEVKQPSRRNTGADVSSPNPPPVQIGLLVTGELEQALKECKEKVENIVKQCRADNRKFRDIEFDLENDAKRCLHGLNPSESITNRPPPDVRRISQIFENPQFFVGSPHSSDIIQGDLGDCWFLSALATMATFPGLVEKLCIARDEQVGIYGFIFFKNSQWVNVVIDDQLFWSLPKFEGLREEEQELYHRDKDLYNMMARRGGKGLKFARSGTMGETWVPLIEKAYAKLHGDYDSLTGGRMSEGIEDLTGQDILDPDKFWNEELLHSNDLRTHLYGVSFPGLSTTRSGNNWVTVGGLYGSHAYSILKVKECRGKRLVVLRNPWGKKEWTGAWSDGSKEWSSPEGLQILKELDHVLGDDGEFVMEYSDFLQTWNSVQRTVIFDPSWIMSAFWLRLPPRSPSCAWSHGEVVYYFNIPKPSKTIIALTCLDDRYFKHIAEYTYFDLEFVLYKLDTQEVQSHSYGGVSFQRGVTCELELEAGDYALYPRVDRHYYNEKGYFEESLKTWDYRKLSRVLSQRIEARSIVTDYTIGEEKKFLPRPLGSIIEQGILSAKIESEKENQASVTLSDKSETENVTTTTTTTVVTEKKTVITQPGKSGMTASLTKSSLDSMSNIQGEDAAQSKSRASTDTPQSDMADVDYADDEWDGQPPAESSAPPVVSQSITHVDEDEIPLFLGLRIYTKKDVVVVVTGSVKDIAR